MRESNQVKKYFWRIVIFTFFSSYTYAIFRYNVFGPVPWKDVAFLIFNKAISLTAFAILIFGFCLKPMNDLGVNISHDLLKTSGALGMLGFILTLLHIVLSFTLVNPNYFKKFFVADGTFTTLAGLSMLGGAISFVVLWCYNLSLQERYRKNKIFIQFFSSRNFVLLTLFFGGIHLFFMGYAGWLTPAKWYGGLPPISLVSFTLFLIGFVINLIGRK